jgi:hypothetical protein
MSLKKQTFKLLKVNVEEAGTEALNSENQKKVRSSSNHCVLRGQPHQVGTAKHRIVSLFVVGSNKKEFTKMTGNTKVPFDAFSSKLDSSHSKEEQC